MDSTIRDLADYRTDQFHEWVVRRDPLFAATCQHTTISTANNETTGEISTELTEADNDTLYCYVCYDKFPKSTLWSKCQFPGNRFCNECVRTYLNFEIAKANIHNGGINCLCKGGEYCSFVFEQEDIFEIVLDEETRQKFIAFKKVKEIVADTTKRYCPGANCGAVVCITDGGRRAKCSSCKLKFCATCNHSHSVFVSCNYAVDSEFRKWKGSTQQGCQRCPQCRLFIEKNEGCNHMTCTNCRHEFCWLCLSAWNGGCSKRKMCKGLAVINSDKWGSTPVLRQFNQFVGISIGTSLAIGVASAGAGLALGVGAFALVVAVPVAAIGGTGYGAYRGGKYIKKRINRNGNVNFASPLSVAEESKWGIRIICPWSRNDRNYLAELAKSNPLDAKFMGYRGRVENGIFISYCQFGSLLGGASPPLYFVPFDTPLNFVANCMLSPMLEVTYPHNAVPTVDQQIENLLEDITYQIRFLLQNHSGGDPKTMPSADVFPIEPEHAFYDDHQLLGRRRLLSEIETRLQNEPQRITVDFGTYEASIRHRSLSL